MVLLVPIASALLALAAFLVYAALRYAPVIGRIFEEAPVFLPLRVSPEPGGEEIRFRSDDGLELAGAYYKSRTGSRAGVVVFCHEFLGDRWSFAPYADVLRDLGFDVFTFDFRNHGDSGSDPAYQPLQWVSDHEARDLRAALAYLRTRPDRDPAGFGLFGISRGGGAALCVAAEDPSVWGVVTDGAFPTRGTVLAYIYRWAEIYVSTMKLWRFMPRWVFAFVGWAGRVRTEWRLGRRYPDIERATSRLAPRPWLMIHGAKDAYIGEDIARGLFAEAGEPKQLWVVPGAKHNRCREVDPEEYRERVTAFFGQYAPRRLASAPGPVPAAPSPAVELVVSSGRRAAAKPTAVPATGEPAAARVPG
jgi:pimeloyl-ACP methyl ester carboxylesterase